MAKLKQNILLLLLGECFVSTQLVAESSPDTVLNVPTLMSGCDLSGIQSLHWKSPWSIPEGASLASGHINSIERLRKIARILESLSSIEDSKLFDRKLDQELDNLIEAVTYNFSDFEFSEYSKFESEARYRLVGEDQDGYLSIRLQSKSASFLDSQKMKRLWQQIDKEYGPVLESRWSKMLLTSDSNWLQLRGQLFLLRHTQVGKKFYKIMNFLMKDRGKKWSEFEQVFVSTLVNLRKKDDLILSKSFANGNSLTHFKCQTYDLLSSGIRDMGAIQDLLVEPVSAEVSGSRLNLWYHDDLRHAAEGCSNEISYQLSEDKVFCNSQNAVLSHLSLVFSPDTTDFSIRRFRQSIVPAVYTSDFKTETSENTFKIVTQDKQVTFAATDDSYDLKFQNGFDHVDLDTAFNLEIENRMNSVQKNETYTGNTSSQYYFSHKFSRDLKFENASVQTELGEFEVVLRKNTPSQGERDQGSHIVYPIPDRRGFLVLQNSRLTILTIVP